MSDIALVKADFRALFPEFSSTGQYPDDKIDLMWTLATSYVDPSDDWGDTQKKTHALYLMLAHLLHLDRASQTSGHQNIIGEVTQATIDKVSISLAQSAQTTSGFASFLMATNYGKMLRALLRTQAVGISYYGRAQ
jgi:hypothetical protein